MAKLCFDEECKELEDNSSIQETSEELGIPFGCQNGICGTCRVRVVEGKENLNEATEAEVTMGIDLDNGERLACQCNIHQGTVKLKET
tara:strand:+ start:419 stop:682 length:264 start_codon:yes stop_codon:yes gene_type:complete